MASGNVLGPDMSLDLKRQFIAQLVETSRLLRNYIDHRAKTRGTTRAQWIVLFRLRQNEGLSQVDLADGLELQVSLSKDVNSCCTTGPFISGTEHWAALCRASSPAPSTLYGLSVRRLISFDCGFLPTGPHDPAVASV